MSVGSKIGTKSWSSSPQNEIRKSENLNLNSATDMQKIGGQDLGEVLNKLSDPNYVDPSKRTRGVGSDKLDKEAFMKLMLAQMKNQDPTNPMKNHEMAAQLAQFSGLEQMQNINTTLTEMQKGQKPAENFQALNFIGKAVAGDSSKVIRLKGDKEHEFSFALPDDAQDVQIKVRGQDGDVIRTTNLHQLKKGDNHWSWNGKNDIGGVAPVGEYQFFIEAKTGSGKKLSVKTDFSGIISGVSYSAEGPVLMVGTQSVRLKDVRKIVDPSLKNSSQGGNQGSNQSIDQKSNVTITPDLNNGPSASENEDKGAEDAALTPMNLMSNVGMSSGMMDKLKKETAPETPHLPVPMERADVATKPVLKPESKTQSKTEESEGGKTGGKSIKADKHAGSHVPVPS